jgi:type I restriction enzyme S subunit
MNKYQSYKPSGIEWVGEIPEHWENRKLKWDIFYQEGPGLRTFQFTEDGIRVICVSNITEKGIDFETTHTRHISKEEYEEKYKHFTVNDNDILLSSSGSIGKVCKYFYDGEPVILNTSTIRIHSKNNKKYIEDFVKYVLISNYVQIQLRFLMTGGIVSNFGPSHLDQIFNYVPPLTEQLQIVQFSPNIL